MMRVSCCALVGLLALAAPAVGDPSPSPLAEKAHAILRRHCHRCHGRDGSVEGGFNYVLNRTRLVGRKKVVPGKPETSLLYRRLVSADAPMPPEDIRPRPQAEELATLKEWIAAGAPDFQPPAARGFLTAKDTLKAILADLQGVRPADRRFTRYFTLTHLSNAGAGPDELGTYRVALSKLVNSLSWEPEITRPHSVDEGGTLYRIDLRDYQWTPTLWEQLLSRYPYGIPYGFPAARTIQTLTGSPMAWMRGDWFLHAAARPPLYHELLRLPRTMRSLEEKLLIDPDARLDRLRTVRAGFNGSGVSRHNRLVERHRTGFGAYWRTFDFASSTGRKNLFAHPLGPGGGENTFRHDGGEIIFNLPNGLQAYLLVDARGDRIDRAPTEIVSDPRRLDRAVLNGISCMTCHVRGMIAKDDQVRAHVRANPDAYTPEEVQQVLALYPPEKSFTLLLAEDARRFRAAAEEAGVRLGTAEPIAAVADRFEAELDLPLASAELGLTPDDFLKRLEGLPALSRTFGPLALAGGTVQRPVFERSFPDLVKGMGLGEVATPVAVGFPRGSGAPTIPPPRLEKSKVVVTLPEPFAQVRTAGAGRYLIFHLKKAKKLAVFDISQVRFVHEIPFPTDEVLFAGGRDHLLVVLPGLRLVQRWSLSTFRREKVAPIPGGQAIRKVWMGSSGTGPLLMWPGGKMILWDVQAMEAMEVEGDILEANPRWPAHLTLSADGRTFVQAPTGGPHSHKVMRVEGNRVTLQGTPYAFSMNGHYTLPNADASLFFAFNAEVEIYSGGFERLTSKGLKDTALLPTEDPRYFLLLRPGPRRDPRSPRDNDSISICTSADRQEIHTVTDLESMTREWDPRRWGHFEFEPRARYLPSAHVLVVLPGTNDRIVLRPLNLIEALEASGKDYLFAASQPLTRAKLGAPYHYRIQARSRHPVTYHLETGPEGMTVSAGGEVRWDVPPRLDGKTFPVIVTLRSTEGKELYHSYKLKVE